MDRFIIIGRHNDLFCSQSSLTFCERVRCLHFVGNTIFRDCRNSNHVFSTSATSNSAFFGQNRKTEIVKLIRKECQFAPHFSSSVVSGIRGRSCRLNRSGNPDRGSRIVGRPGEAASFHPNIRWDKSAPITKMFDGGFFIGSTRFTQIFDHKS